MTDLDIQELANLTAGDADVDNFERLFTKLKEMKGKTQCTTMHNSPSCVGLYQVFFLCWPVIQHFVDAGKYLGRH